MVHTNSINKNNIILITGAVGFIGFHLSKELIKLGYKIVCVDNINDYYDINLKLARLNKLEKTSKLTKNIFNFYKVNLEDADNLNDIFKKHKPNIIFHLAAQAGVRYSLINPSSYIKSNIVGFSNILEISRMFKIENLIFASSSSVYGGNCKIPFSESDSVNHPVSLYAATKKSNELMAHSYSHLFGLPTIGLRFFTVYGPWGRPDMSPMIFANAIYQGKPIKIFNYGNMERDFTYVDDVTSIMIKLIDKPSLGNKIFNKFNPDPSESWAPYRIFNIGNNNCIKLMDFIGALEDEIGIKAIKEYQPMQPGDVEKTFADTSQIENYIGCKPNTSIKEGISEFIFWYKNYFNIKK